MEPARADRTGCRGHRATGCAGPDQRSRLPDASVAARTQPPLGYLVTGSLFQRLGLTGRRAGSDKYAINSYDGRDRKGQAGFQKPGGTRAGQSRPNRPRCHLHPGRLGRVAGRARPQFAGGGPARCSANAGGQALRAGIALAARHRLRGLCTLATWRSGVRRHR